MFREQLKEHVQYDVMYVQAIYATYFLWILWKYRVHTLGFPLGLLLLSIIFLVISGYYDRMVRITAMIGHIDPLCYSFSALPPARGNKIQTAAVLEEGFKWLGFVAWFFLQSCKGPVHTTGSTLK
ncbi:MAG: hypothetical protein QGH33_19535 [Pirellulaceae bacterium]|nr:hypothetical protein [Pirellulaceae bacterium]